MEFESLEAIIDFAIDKEREAAEFYQKISDDEEDFSGSKQMFAEFAAEEKKHEKINQGKAFIRNRAPGPGFLCAK